MSSGIAVAESSPSEWWLEVTMLAERLTIIVVTFKSMQVLPLFLRQVREALAEEQCPIFACDNCSTMAWKIF